MPKDAPYLDKKMQGWIVNTAKREYWRFASCSSWYTTGDLIQDGYMCYAKCWAKYSKKVNGKPSKFFDVANPTDEQRRWFMALVQRAFYNHIKTLHRVAVLRVAEDGISQIAEPTDTIAQAFDRIAPPVAEEASLLLALAKAPAEFVEVLEKLARDGFDGGDYLRRRVLNLNGKLGKQTVRETTAEYWTRVLGVADMPERLVDYLKV